MDEIEFERLSRAHPDVLRRNAALEVCSRRTLDRLIHENRFTVMHDGVIAMSPSPVDVLTTARAAIVWADRDLVASHRFAAWLHRLDGSAPAIEFSTPINSRYLAAPGLSIHRVKRLETTDICARRGFRTTTLVRTLLDLASSSPDDVPRRMLVAAFEDAYRRGSYYRDKIVEHIQTSKKAAPRWPLLLDLATRRPRDSKPTESIAESICDDILWCGGIQPERQHELFKRSGEFVARVDFAFPFLKLAIEVDGYATHSSRHAYYRDKRRMQEILRLGWEVLPVVWSDFDDEARLVRLVRDVVDQRRALFRSTAPIGPSPGHQLVLSL